METVEQFISYAGHFYSDTIVNDTHVLFAKLMTYQPNSTDVLKRELFYLNYFLWDYMLHMLSSICNSERRMKESEIYAKIRDSIVVTLNSKNLLNDINESSEACDSYKEALSKGADQSQRLINLGLEFGKRTGNLDLRFCMIVTMHYKGIMDVMPSAIEKLTRKFIKQNS